MSTSDRPSSPERPSGTDTDGLLAEQLLRLTRRLHRIHPPSQLIEPKLARQSRPRTRRAERVDGAQGAPRVGGAESSLA